MMETLTDRQLMSRFVGEDDRSAFDEIVRRWDRRVLGFLAKAAGDLDAAEDLRQEVFLRVHRYAGSYDARFAFATWLFRIAGNALKTWQAKEGRRREVSLSGDGASTLFDPVDLAPSPRDKAASAESDDLVRAAIARLEVEERQLLLLRFDLDLSYREIAQIQETPETTIKSRVYSLLARLRREFTEQETLERTHCR